MFAVRNCGATGAGPKGQGLALELGLGLEHVFGAHSIPSSSRSSNFHPDSAGESKETTEGFVTVLGTHPQNNRQHKRTLRFN